LTYFNGFFGRFLAPFWLAILGFGKGIFSGWGFLAGLGIFGSIGDFWQLGVFGGVQRIFPTLGKFCWDGRK